MIGVRLVKLDPKDPHIVYATALNNAIHRSAPSLEDGDASFKPVFAIVGTAAVPGSRDVRPDTKRQAHADLRRTTARVKRATQGLYRLDDADVPAATLVTGSGASARQHRRLDQAHVERRGRSPGSTSRRICSPQCFYDLVVAVPDGQPDTVIIGGVAHAGLRRADDAIDGRRA